jgi:hypothetical protein
MGFSIIAKGIVAALAHVDDIQALAAAIEQEIQVVAHGEGGLGKVANAAAVAGSIAASVGKVVQNVASAAAPAPAAQG